MAAELMRLINRYYRYSTTNDEDEDNIDADDGDSCTIL